MEEIPISPIAHFLNRPNTDSGLFEIAPKIGDPLCLGYYLDSFDLLMSNPMAAPAGAAIGLAVFSWAH
jgi:hypothetical protein